MDTVQGRRVGGVGLHTRSGMFSVAAALGVVGGVVLAGALLLAAGNDGTSDTRGAQAAEPARGGLDKGDAVRARDATVGREPGFDVGAASAGFNPCPPPEPTNDPCLDLAPSQCIIDPVQDEQCRPTMVQNQGGRAFAIECACISPGDKCGPIDISPLGDMIFCPGGCPWPNSPGFCEIHFDGNPMGDSSWPATGIPPGVIVTCACPGGGPEPDPHLTVQPTQINFGSVDVPAVPADFFGPGSDPFDDSVEVQGGPSDTLVQRMSDANCPPLGACETIDIEIVELSLVSVGPITVRFNGGASTEDWDLAIGLSGGAGSGLGSLLPTKTHPNGGSYDAQLPVLPRLTFTKVGNPLDIRVLDYDSEGLDPIEINFDDVPWVINLGPHLQGNVEAHSDGNFVPGVDEIIPGDPNSQVVVDATGLSKGGGVDHTVQPLPIPVPCCLLSGDCIDMPLEDCEAQLGSVVSQCPPPDSDGISRCIPPGNDCFPTPPGATQVSFAKNPIPADFFDPGSEPFDGVIRLQGATYPTGTDTIIRRRQAAAPQMPPDPVSPKIECEILALSLSSVDPISVVFDDGSFALWDVEVKLSPTTVPLGEMTITKTHINGGYFRSSFYVQPLFRFCRAGGGICLDLDTGAIGKLPVVLTTVGRPPWIREAMGSVAGAPVLCDAVNFTPGAQWNPQTLNMCCVQVGHAGPGHLHVTGTVCNPCPEGACCNTASGGCTLAHGAADCNGLYMGDGTDCQDSDGDGIADWFETNNCNDPNRNNCFTGTDPNNPDTDGDGFTDGFEIRKTKCDPCVHDPDMDEDGYPDTCPHFVKFSQPPKSAPPISTCSNIPGMLCITDVDCWVCVGGVFNGLPCPNGDDDCDADGSCDMSGTCDPEPSTDAGEDYPSNIDWVDMDPNQVAADDFVSDGRPITAVRWWGSNIPKFVPTDPKLCPVEGVICDDPALMCVCTQRIDGTLNCADPDTWSDPCPPGLQCTDDADCAAPAKCFLVGAAGCCGYNCGEVPVDPKVCDPEGAICDDPALGCVCAPRIDGTLNCLDPATIVPPCAQPCTAEADCTDGAKCFDQAGGVGCCGYNCGEGPVDPKDCEGKGSACGGAGDDCICETRPDGRTQCAEANDLLFCPHGLCQTDVECMDPDTKCFVQPGADGCCAHNCGEHPVDPKVCTGKGTSCGDPLQECVCETRFDGTLNCADAGDFFDPTRHGTCPSGDADCPAGTKCFVNAAVPVCAHNCEEHPADPKVCDPEGAICDDPALGCVCALRIDGTTLNCLDPTTIVTPCAQPCAAEGDCSDGAKCFQDPDNPALGCCGYNCGETPVDPKVCTGKGTTCGAAGQDCVCETRFDGTLNCADQVDFDTGRHGYCYNGDSDCPAGTKCFVNPPGATPVCCHNCDEHVDEPKLCDSEGATCDVDPNCVCTRRINGSLNCADSTTLVLPCPLPCTSDAECAAPSKCFIGGDGLGCCGYNCGETPVPKECGNPGLCQMCDNNPDTNCECGLRYDGTTACFDINTANGFPCANDPFPDNRCEGVLGIAGAKCFFDPCRVEFCALNCSNVGPEDRLGTIAEDGAGAVSIVATEPPEPSVEINTLRAIAAVGLESAEPNAPTAAPLPQVIFSEATWEQMQAFDDAYGTSARQVAPVHEGPAPRAVDDGGPVDGQPQATTTPDGSGTVAAPPVTTSFQGITDTGWIPPDTMGAVGMDHIATIVNGGFEVFDRGGGVVSPPITLQGFWSSLGTLPGQPASITFDPKIIYDQYTDRWIVTADGNPNNRDGTNNSWMLVGISQTNTPTGAWNLYAIKANIIDLAAAVDHTNHWSDYPGIGVDPNNVVITNNMFTVAASPSFVHADVWVISKASMMAGGPLNYALFHDPCGTGGFTFQPTHTFGQTPTNAVVHLVDQGWLDLATRIRRFVRVKDITGVGAAAVLFCRGGNDFIEVAGYNFCLADAPQPSCSWPIETNDSRLLNAVSWKGMIWTTHEVGAGAPADAACGAVVPRSKTEVAWYELDPSAAGAFPGGAPNQQGRVVDPSLYYYFPSIAVNKNMCVALGFSGSDDNTFASAYYTVHDPAVDAPGVTQTVSLLKAGVDSYLKTFGAKNGRNRWGDYSATVVDPRDFSRFWTVQEYAEDQNDGLVAPQACVLDAAQWGTWWGSFACENAIDGWFISFHEHLQKDSPQDDPLALYYCDVKMVNIDPTKLPDCQDHNIFEYFVNLDDCCLVHANPDSRTGLVPAMKNAFYEEKCLAYHIDIQAVTGVKYYQDKATGVCIQKKTGKGAFDNYWGWHTTINENGIKPALEGLTKMALSPQERWLYGPWTNVTPKCSFPNMAFELLTSDPPAADPEACCLPDGTCAEMLPQECCTLGGTQKGPGTTCLGVEACCLPGGTCADMDAICCINDGGDPKGAGTVCLGVAACHFPDQTCVDIDEHCCLNQGGMPKPGEFCLGVEACCLPDNTCEEIDALVCLQKGGDPKGPFCGGIAACHFPDQTCVDMDAECCIKKGGIPKPGEHCLGIRACCVADHGCEEIDALVCIQKGGDPKGPFCGGMAACHFPDQTCEDMDTECCIKKGGMPKPGEFCLGVEACCLPDNTCEEIDALVCLQKGGDPKGPGSGCMGVAACHFPDQTCADMDAHCCLNKGGMPKPGEFCLGVEACCLPDNTCEEIDALVCLQKGGDPKGPGGICLGVEACCLPDGTCDDIDRLCCLNKGGTPQGAGTICQPGTCCFPSSRPNLELINKPGAMLNRKNRFISVSLKDAGRWQAIRVVLGAKDAGRGNIPVPFDIWKGQEFYAAEPRPYCENAGQGPLVWPNAGLGCGPAPGVYKNGQDWFWAARLVCDKGTAHYMDWTTLAYYCNTPGAEALDGYPCSVDADCQNAQNPDGRCGVSAVVHLFHEGVVPSHLVSGAGPIGPPPLGQGEAVYEVSVIDSTCPMNVPTSYSPPAQLHQAGWGDVVLNAATCPNWPPEESVGVVTDVVALLNKFSNLPCAIQKTRADLVPCQVDFSIGISDIVASLNAFGGGDYEDVCGSGQCSSLGLCKGGADHGQPCTNDSDCNSDICKGKLEVAATRSGSLGLESKYRHRAVSGDRTRPAGAVITAIPSRTVIQPGDTIDVDVYVADVADLRAYEVKLNVQGGADGQLSLLDLGVDKIRPDYVFSAREEVGAADHSNRRICGALVSGGADAAEQGYLGTYTFQASADASGAFEISIQVDEDASLLLSPLSLRIAFTPESAVVTVSADPVGTIAGDAE